VLAHPANPKSNLLHDLASNTLFGCLALGDLPLTETVLAGSPVLHQQVLLLVVSGDDGPVDGDVLVRLLDLLKAGCFEPELIG
jgi:hypothetical protein